MFLNKKLYPALLTGVFAIGCAFTMNAQSSKKISTKEDPLTPVVRKGDYTDAVFLSANEKIITIYVSGAKRHKDKPEPYTAKQYAIMLQGAFGDKEFTNYPTKTVSFFEENRDEGATLARILINGYDYKTKSGNSDFLPDAIVGYIDVFTKKYRDEIKRLAVR